MNRIFVIGMLILCSFYSYGQTRDSTNKKKIDHYIGIQANALLKQIFNFSNNSTTPSNPYTLTYTVIAANCGWGAHIGFGYEHKKTEDVLNPSNKISKFDNGFFRIGLEKRIPMGRKFSTIFGLDFIDSYEFNATNSTNVTNFGNQIDSSISVIKTKVTGYGGGFQLGLTYSLSQKILIGTEATYYFSKENSKENSEITSYIRNVFLGQTTVSYTNENTEFKSNQVALTLPVVIYLIIKL